MIATDSESEASKATQALGWQPALVLDRFDCARRLTNAARRVRAERISAAVVHSADWSRQPLQRLYELALLRLPVQRRYVLARGCLVELGRMQLLRAAGRTPLDGLAAGSRSFREASRALRPRVPYEPRLGPGDTLVAIWRGEPGMHIGGSVTHAAGILGAFRAHGLRVGLATSFEPPAQLAANIDDVEVAEPLPASQRLTREIEQLCMNAPLRAAASRLSLRLRPAFIYERYGAFLTSGMDVACQTGLPLVLEWNGSEAWVRSNWQRGHAAKRAFEPLLTSIERRALREASLVAAVSSNAAEAAKANRVTIRRLEVIPNGVDVDAIPSAGRRQLHGSGPTLGWVGSFGPWHGAPVLVRALRELPDEITAVMVGDGAGRVPCCELARQLGVDHRIEWTGAVPHRDAVATLATCDVLVSPHVESENQRFFGSPTKIFEFMAIGRPIVASKLEQIGEVLRDGETAKLVTPGDPVSLADGVRAVLARDDQGESLGRAARTEAEQHHSWRARAAVALGCLGFAINAVPDTPRAPMSQPAVT